MSDHLIMRCLDGLASEAEKAALEGLVTRDSSVARELARAAVLESSLTALAQTRTDGAGVPLSDERSQADLEAAVRRAFPARPGLFGGGARRPLPPRSLEGRRLPLVLIAAALAVAGIGAAFIVAHPWAHPTPPLAPPPTPPLTLALPPTPTPTPTPPLTPPLPPMIEPGTATAEPPTMATAATSDAPAGAERAPGARNASVAADSLRAANQLRRQSRWADAARAYSQIAGDYAGTAQGGVAALAAASLRLEHLDDPRGALRLYQTALRSSELAAEAELGIADCYRALGDRDAEAAALHRLVSGHPDALSRERATQRLKELQSAKP